MVFSLERNGIALIADRASILLNLFAFLNKFYRSPSAISLYVTTNTMLYQQKDLHPINSVFVYW